MPARNNTYTVGFVSVIALIFSLILSLAAGMLKERQERNVANDIKKNILESMSALPEGKPTADEIAAIFENQVQAVVLDANGNVVADKIASDIDPEAEADKPEADRQFPLYILKGSDGSPKAYAFPVEGKGLWSTMYGYLSLDGDLNTVRGITFYKHGETPGLGGEISASWFKEQFVGKKVWNTDGQLVSVSVVKGAAADKYSGEPLTHYVDGIGGATITSKGVTTLLQEDVAKYKAYFDRIRGTGGKDNG